MQKLTVGSLFAGIGGIDLGLERTGGFKTVWQVENGEYATRVLEKDWPAVRRWRDVATFPPDAKREGLPFRESECGNDEGCHPIRVPSEVDYKGSAVTRYH